jgi:hypothetical protein
MTTLSRRLALVVVFAAGLAVAGCPGAETPVDSWVGHTDATGKYTCKFPETPRSKVETQQTAGGPLQSHSSYVEDRRRAYMVMWADMPAGGVGDHNRTEVLDGAVEGAVRGGKATLESSSAILVAGNEGREYRANATDGTKFHARVFLVGDRMYQMIVVYGERFAPAAEFFFNSFQLNP